MKKLFKTLIVVTLALVFAGSFLVSKLQGTNVFASGTTNNGNASETVLSPAEILHINTLLTEPLSIDKQKASFTIVNHGYGGTEDVIGDGNLGDTASLI
jgi:hypothetical protein